MENKTDPHGPASTLIPSLCGLRATDLEFLCRLPEICRQPWNCSHSGSIMKDHSRTDLANPYSPLMCGLLLLLVLAAIQLKVLAWF
jgi:hypothetical protein